MFKEIVVSASSVDTGLAVWDLSLGTLLGSFRSCASGRNSVACIGSDYLVASQLSKGPGGGGGSLFFWSWIKNQVAVRSFPVEPLGALVATSDGAFCAGGSLSGRVYIWEVSSGKLLRSMQAHYKAITCLTFSDDDSLLISGADDAIVNVWPLLRAVDLHGAASGDAMQPLYAWSEHTLSITAVVAGSGGSSAVIVSSSLDHTCKIWSLCLGTILRTIVFPTGINVAVMDAAEYCLYAGGTDGRIYVTPLNGGIPTFNRNSSPNMSGDVPLIGHCQAVTSLVFSLDGVTLVSGSEDSTVKIWDTISRQVLRTFNHGKGPVTNVLVVPRPQGLLGLEPIKARNRASTIPLGVFQKYPATGQPAANDPAPWEGAPVMLLGARPLPPKRSFPSGVPLSEKENEDQSYSVAQLDRQVLEAETRETVAAVQMEVDKVRSDLRRALDNGQGWHEVYQDLMSFCVEEILNPKKERKDFAREQQQHMQA